MALSHWQTRVLKSPGPLPSLWIRKADLEVMLHLIVLKGCHRGLWNEQRLVILRSPDRLRLYSRLEVPRHVWVDLYLRCPRDRLQRPFKEGPRNKPRLVDRVAGTSTQPVPSTSFQLRDPPSRTPEAMVIGVSERPLSTESESDSSRVSSGEEELRAACRPLGGGSCRVRANGTAAGLKRKTEAGPTTPQSKKEKEGPQAGETFCQAERDNRFGVVLVEGHPYTVLKKAQ